jgi:hypothetical protein
MSDQDRPRRPTWIPVVLGFVFGAVLILLVLNGGMCERYERKMERQRMMREHMDSMRRTSP